MREYTTSIPQSSVSSYKKGSIAVVLYIIDMYCSTKYVVDVIFLDWMMPYPDSFCCYS